jgi:hypothetical protein
MWILKIRVGKEFYPVNWETGNVVWDKDTVVRPTIFSAGRRLDADLELRRTGHKPEDYKWVKKLKLISDQTHSHPETSEEGKTT